MDNRKRTLISNHWQNLNDTLQYTNVINSQIQQKPKLNTVIIIPIRNRDRHLAYVTNYVTDYINKYDKSINLVEIIAVEQIESDMKPFNKGFLFNIGVNYIKTHNKYVNISWIILHDVDWFPKLPTSYYPLLPSIHFQHIMPISTKNSYGAYIGTGGASAISLHAYTDCINGFSNQYFGWGAEDEDIFFRLASQRYLPRCNLSITNLVYLRARARNGQSPYAVYKDYTLNESHSETFHDEYHWRMDYKDRTVKSHKIAGNQLNCNRLAMAVCDKNGDLMKSDGYNNFGKDIKYKIHGCDEFGKLRIIRLSILDYNQTWVDEINQYIITDQLRCRFPKCK